MDQWKQRTAVKSQAAKLEQGLHLWCLEQDIKDRDFFGAPYVMLHSLSHLLINAISLECGYPASSIKERIYANENQGYGILLYTASADSHGTLGGLANAAKSIGHLPENGPRDGATVLERSRSAPSTTRAMPTNVATCRARPVMAAC